MAKGESQRRVVAVSSAGGVLLDLLEFDDWWSNDHVTWVAVDAVDTRRLLQDRDVRFDSEPRTDPPALLSATRRAWTVLGELRPHVVVSAGTAIAVPYFLAARLLRIPAVWVETLNIVARQGKAARVCSRLAVTTVVQRPERLAAHRRAVMVGELY